MRGALAILAVMLVAAPAIADVVELKAGQKLEGKVKQVTPTEVIIEVGGKDTKVERDKVRAMKDALSLFTFALTAWETRLRTYGYAALEIDPVAEKCAPLKKLLEREEKAVPEEDARQQARFERETKAREAAKEPPPPEPAPIAFRRGPDDRDEGDRRGVDVRRRQGHRGATRPRRVTAAREEVGYPSFGPP